jgi:chromosomal replication initiator protein
MNKEEFWQAVLGEIELSISKASFTTWFKNTSILETSETEVVIGVPNIFAKEWLEKKYRKIILSSINKFYPKIGSFSCSTENKEKTKTIDSVVDGSNVVNLKKTPKALKNNFSNNQNTNLITTADTNLNGRYKFDTFVVGSNNELAYAACSSIVEAPGENYNPLFVYGGVGLGKTHLLQATGNAIQQNHPQLKIKYLSMERFANELLNALQTSKAREFKKDYIQLDVLIIDDVQFLAKKEKTQEEFFHVFETLYQLGKQVILSSDRPPKSIPTLEDRLRSRFEGGMMADISKPDLETRIAIIQKKLNEKNFKLNKKTVQYLAENIYNNIRELEGALNKIIVTYQLKNSSPNFEEIEELTQDIISSNRKEGLAPEKIIQAVAEFFDVSPDEISSHCRKKRLIKPRQVTIYLIREDIGRSFPEIGQIIGGRDHSTTIYAHKKITKELENNKMLNDHLKFIREKFFDY